MRLRSVSAVVRLSHNERGVETRDSKKRGYSAICKPSVKTVGAVLGAESRSERVPDASKMSHLFETNRHFLLATGCRAFTTG